MKVFQLAYYYKGQYAMKDVKTAIIFANNIEEAKATWSETEPQALYLEQLCEDLGTL